MTERQEQRERQWRERLDEWQGSGISLHAFARRQGLNYLSLRYWRRKFGLGGDAAVESASAAFVAMRLVTEPTVEIVLAAGVTLKVPVAAAADDIARWLAAARAASC